MLHGSAWDWRPVTAEMARMVDEHLGSDDGILVVDESGVRRWGEKSVGIGRQYIGNVGKTDNGQVGVYLTCASEHGQAFLDARPYVLEEWFEDSERCREASSAGGHRVPDETGTRRGDAGRVCAPRHPREVPHGGRDLRRESSVPRPRGFALVSGTSRRCRWTWKCGRRVRQSWARAGVPEGAPA
jgi:hypothetical protein